MTDPTAGVTIEREGKRYTLYLGNRALRLIEERTGRSIADLGNLSSISDLTTIVWAALQRHHAGLTVEDVDEIIDHFGYQAIGEALAQAMQAAFPNVSQGGNPFAVAVQAAQA